jgi:hypothetical protein
MESRNGPFLFASPDGKAPRTARKVHVRRLLDILHLSIQRGDLPLARRAFGLLARCEEIEWMVVWKIGLAILAAAKLPPGDILGTAKRIEFLRVMMLHNPEEVRASHSSRLVFRPSACPRRRQSDLPVPAFQRESLLQELVLSLALAGRERDALDELELCGSLRSWLLHTTQLKQCSYLPSPPYQDNSALHTYAGLLSLRLALFAETDSRRGTQGKCKASVTHHNRVRINQLLSVK